MKSLNFRAEQSAKQKIRQAHTHIHTHTTNMHKYTRTKHTRTHKHAHARNATTIAREYVYAVCCRVLECCRVLRCVAVCGTHQAARECVSTVVLDMQQQQVAGAVFLQFVAECCSVLQSVAVCCSVLQRVAECCGNLDLFDDSQFERILLLRRHSGH